MTAASRIGYPDEAVPTESSRRPTARVTRNQAVGAPRFREVTLSCSYKERSNFSDPKGFSGPPVFDNRTISLSLVTISPLPRSTAVGSTSRHLAFSLLPLIPASTVAASEVEPMQTVWRVAPG